MTDIPLEQVGREVVVSRQRKWVGRTSVIRQCRAGQLELRVVIQIVRDEYTAYKSERYGGAGVGCRQRRTRRQEPSVLAVREDDAM